MIYTSQFQKTGVTFTSGEEANADRMQGMSAALLEQYKSIDESLISQGVLVAEETYSWNQNTKTLTITRDVTDTIKYFAIKDTISPEVMEVATTNGWTRTKKMIPD